eukprot:gi/632969110/ref/XP_007900907.1/ PREDICTED: LOW QUALITY PROTEIN: fibrocystin-L [Callorhinchus milii]
MGFLPHVSDNLPEIKMWKHAAISHIEPHIGSTNGATRLTIRGTGFAGENQFNYGSGNEKLGNSVSLVSDVRSIPCDVEKDSSDETQIICITRPLPDDRYYVAVSVDGVPITDSGYRWSFRSRLDKTPTIDGIFPISGLPGTLITMHGQVFTDVFGSHSVQSSKKTRLLRVYFGGMPCELLHPDSDTLYGLELESEHSSMGTITCKITGTYVGDHNVSFIVERYGRSLPETYTHFVSSLNKISMFQTFAEIRGIYPSAGSVEGGTRLTVTGQFFDETDSSARVMIKGQNCDIISLSNNQIICKTPKEDNTERTIFPGGRGLKLEIWTNSNPESLSEILNYNNSTPGYSVNWVDTLSYERSKDSDPFVARFSGFFVPPVTDNYRFYIKGRGSYALHFSSTGHPQDKVQINFGKWIIYASKSYHLFRWPKASVVHLQKGKEYYIEVLVKERADFHSVTISAYRESSTYLEQQTSDAVSEQQLIDTTSTVKLEKQVLTLKNWKIGYAVHEIQNVTVNSPCQESNTCFDHWYRLSYNKAKTGLLPADASAYQVQTALNNLLPIKPDHIEVTERPNSKGFSYSVIFVSNRGDFELLEYEVLGGTNVTIEVVEQIKGEPSLETFTLILDGISSRPLSANATATEVKGAIEELVGVKCPERMIQYTEGYAVKYFQDFESGSSTFTSQGKVTIETDAFCGRYCLINPNYLFISEDEFIPLTKYKQLCFAYKGFLLNQLRLHLSYQQQTLQYNTQITFSYPFSQGEKWSHTCINLLDLVESKYPTGSNFLLHRIALDKATWHQDFFVDVVYLGQQATTQSQLDIEMRNPPALLDKGLIFKDFKVTQRRNKNADVNNEYEVTMIPINCGHSIPLLQVGFAQVLANNTEDEAAYKGTTWPEGAVLIVRRIDAASRPVGGTFDIEIFGKSLRDLPVNSTALEMQYALQTIAEIGTVSVSRNGGCTGYRWWVKWLTKSGKQPTLQVNNSKVTGTNAKIIVQVTKEGGLFNQRLTGDMLRTPNTKPQVEVFINGIPSKCSDNCGYTWSSGKTPVISHISPTVDSCANGTMLSISGSNFANCSATDDTWVSVGDARCQITGLTDNEITCRIGNASLISSPVTVYIAELGIAKHAGNQTFVFTYQAEVKSISPSSGSSAGGTILTVSGCSFTQNSTVWIGEELCGHLMASHNEIKCRTPSVSVLRDSSSLALRYLSFRSEDSSVLVGKVKCPILEWTSSLITCRLPKQSPGLYYVQVGVTGAFANVSSSINASIEYRLCVTSVTPQHGSLYGGTKVTVSGIGFSPVLEENLILFGSVPCNITSTSVSKLECVVLPTRRRHLITSNGTDPYHGQGYSWNPSSLDIFVGDMVQWQWEAPGLVKGLRYRVYRVARPSDVNYDGDGFISGTSSSVSGSFSYHFTSPGSFYYSSGFVNPAQSIYLQGVVNVRPAQERVTKLYLYVAGIEAEYETGQMEELLSPNPLDDNSTGSNMEFNQTSVGATDVDGFPFVFSSHWSPTINSIKPTKGTFYDILTITGTGFCDASCSNEVTVGDHPCVVENSTNSEITCQLDPEGVMEVGIAALVSVTVQNLGTAINTLTNEFDRRFVLLPIIDSISPEIGSTTGMTRVNITGSGFAGNIMHVEVLLAGVPCSVVTVNYTQIICESSPSVPFSGIVKLSVHGILAECNGSCNYVYTDSVTPLLLDIYPRVLNTNNTKLTIRGNGFGDNADMVYVFIGNTQFMPQAVSDTNITCTVRPLPAGNYSVKVLIMDKGLSSEGGIITSAATASLTPTSGGINGGTTLFIEGNGFVQGYTTVTVHGSLCSILSVTPSEVQCITPACPPGIANVNIVVQTVSYPFLTFICNQTETPNIVAVTPTGGLSGTRITITGSGFGSIAANISVTIDDVLCFVTFASDSNVECIVGDHPGGTFPVILKHATNGYTASDVFFQYELNITSVNPRKGSFGGGLILTLNGAGFDRENSRVSICDDECRVNSSTSTSSTLHCILPPSKGPEPQHTCNVTVKNDNHLAQLPTAFTYSSALTPVIIDVYPRRGGTAGGTTLTITGAIFSLTINETVVTIAETPCDVQFVNETCIICITNAHSPSQLTRVNVKIGEYGVARQDNADFYYIDVWSSPYTWGGLSPPEGGFLVVISKGQIILLDQSTPVLKMLLIQGGKLMFDEADIELQAENILITDGGVLQIGTESSPFRHKGIITLHGHSRSKELPLYGAKTLAVREGTLDLHGLPIPVVWTHLAQTAIAGSTTVILQKSVTWKAGDVIVIASTGHRHSQSENEKKTIASVSADGKSLNLTEPLQYNHLGVSVPLPDGTMFEGRAEVGLLTRNVVVRGSNNVEWNDHIEACPDGFNMGQFAVQTCFQGRFGEEIGSDQFGGCIMFHAPRPSSGLAQGRIEYVEMYYVGQAFRLGRYPIHWHLLGNMKYQSYVRGCGIHQTFNRAVTIHNTHKLLVEHNVIYDIMGGGFFIQDGIEHHNILQYNLAVYVRQSTSLLNDDITPAAFWITNPNNIIRHNAVAGGTHFGFWYRMNDHPDGPSHTTFVCQKKVPLGEFRNNTVHSQGWFGLWIFEEYFPMSWRHCYSTIPEPARFESLTTWNCEKGAEWVNGGALQFHNFVMVNNEKAGIEMKRVLSSYVKGWGESSGAVITNTTVIGHMDELGLDSDYCTSRGIILPLDDGLTVSSVKFVNFDRPSCAGIGVASITGFCSNKCGGWSARFSDIHYLNTTNKAAFRWEHEVVLHDLDGSLTGHTNYKVVPKSFLYDPARCHPSTEWSTGYPGLLCDSTIRFHRLAFNNLSPSSLVGKNVILAGSYGISIIPFLSNRLTHSPGWMALIPNNGTLNFNFEGMDYVTNISYRATFYGFKEEDYIIISHNFTQHPDMFQITNSYNGSLHPLSWSNNTNGDWYFEKENTTLYYLVSGRNTLQSRYVTQNLDSTMTDVNVHLNVYRCFFKHCNPPPPPTMPSLKKQLDGYDLWSNSSFWRLSPENNYTVPAEGDSVVIPPGTWLVVDTDIPSLNKLTIYGILELKDDILSNSTRANSSSYMNIVLNATYISIQGGRLIAGQEGKPFRGKIQIVLRGDHLTPDWPLPNGPNQGSKVLGVFGGLDLHGIGHSVYKTKLALTALAGSTNVTLAEAVDWQDGDQIVVTTTSYDAQQTEIRTISSISFDGITLLLDRPLSYTHISEKHEVEGTGQSYRLAADVGLLSRNIKITGHDYPGWVKESFGARVLVSTFTINRLKYKGYARINNVEFYHSGQKGYEDYFDPRYSVAFLNLGQISGNDASYIRGCAFHHGFAPAIGVFGTDGLDVDDNIIHHTLGDGIRLWGNRNRVRRNLVCLAMWSTSYLSWNAAIEVNEGHEVVLQDNVVAGFQRVAYRIDGEPCPGQKNPVEVWSNNEAHGGLYGVYMNQDGLYTCSLIQGFTIWKCWDYGIYFQTSQSVQISSVTLVDNGMGIFSMIYKPSATSHQMSNKTVLINSTLVVGTSPKFNCSDVLTSDPNLSITRLDRSTRPPSGGRSGICWPTFASAQNHAPEHSHAGLMSYPAISGLMIVQNTTFVGFKGVCSGEVNVMFITSPLNEDLQHPISVEGITMVDSEEPGKVYIHRPNLKKVNPSDCVDMDCDAKKKSLLKDLDGSFLGAVGAVVPQSEYEWNGDKRHGLGDYRIPKVVLTYLNGSRIPVPQIAPHQGIIRDSSCTYMSDWQSYKCFGLNYEMLVIESLDSDSETRRLSPVALLADGYIDLINGPQDHGWCSGYTCRRRISLFHGIVATNKSYDIYFTSTTPQTLQLMLLNVNDSKAVRLAIYYFTPQRLDVYVNEQFVAPTNAAWNAQHTDFTLKAPIYPGQYLPPLDSTVPGSNYFDRTYQMLNVLVRGSTPVKIRTTPVLFISFNLPAMTVDDFYDSALANNLALFLNIPSSKIRITKIVREGSRRRKRAPGITVEFQIAEPPVQQLSADQNVTANTTTNPDTLSFSGLNEMASNLSEAMLTGNISEALGFTISSMGISTPVPPPGDPEWEKVASKPVNRTTASESYVAVVEALVVVVQPVGGEPGQLLLQQPSVMSVDYYGNCVSVGAASWTLLAVLKDAENRNVAGLNGTTCIVFSGCWANYTDLALAQNGTDYKLEFTMKTIQMRSHFFSMGQQNNTSAMHQLTPSGSASLTDDQRQAIIAGTVVGVCVFALIVAVSVILTKSKICKAKISNGFHQSQQQQQQDYICTAPFTSGGCPKAQSLYGKGDDISGCDNPSYTLPGVVN